MSKVRDGVVIKVSRDVYADLVRAVGAYASKYGRRVTYSDVIKAALSSVPDIVKAIEEYVKKRGDG